MKIQAVSIITENSGFEQKKTPKVSQGTSGSPGVRKDTQCLQASLACTVSSAAVPAPRSGTISRMRSRPAAAQHLEDLARLRRVRDRIDREYAQPLDVEALARGAHMSAGQESRSVGHRGHLE